MYSGGYDEVDGLHDINAAKRRKDSGWWGDQTLNPSYRLSTDDLRNALYRKSASCVNLDSPGVYIYVNKYNGKIYIGSAAKQTLLQRQQQHLYSASHLGGQVGKFDAALSYNFSAAAWDFDALSMAGCGDWQIHAKERELILKYRSDLSQFGYNTQLQGGQ